VPAGRPIGICRRHCVNSCQSSVRSGLGKVKIRNLGGER
jgi:hypothetical protein